MNEWQDKESLKSFGPLTLSKEGNYDTIKCHGPMTLKASITANTVKVNGPLIASTEKVTIDFLKVNGPATIESELTVTEVKINGPTKIKGSIHLKDWGKINGPFTCRGTLELDKTASVKINGPITAEKIIGGKDVILNGPASVNEIENVGLLEARGGVNGDRITASEVYISIGRRGKAHVRIIEADQVVIEKNIERSIKGFGIGERIFTRFLKKQLSYELGNGDIQLVDEIRAKEKVFLSHAHVKKVIARELELGENAEVDEFIKIIEE